MQSSKVLTVAMLALVALGGAASAQTGEKVKVKRDRNLITEDEIASSQVTNALQVVEKLRPNFLRRAERQQTVYGRNRGSDQATPASGGDITDGTSGGMEVRVFVDGNELGGPRDLQRIPANTVLEIRYLSAADAQQRFGPRYAGGVIDVKLKS